MSSNVMNEEIFLSNRYGTARYLPCRCPGVVPCVPLRSPEHRKSVVFLVGVTIPDLSFGNGVRRNTALGLHVVGLGWEQK